MRRRKITATTITKKKKRKQTVKCELEMTNAKKLRNFKRLIGTNDDDADAVKAMNKL